jgi:hypothetical protein
MIEQTLNALVGPILQDRFFPGTAPLDTPRPYGYFNQIGGKTVEFLGGEEPSQRNALIQLNVWADTAEEASLLIQQIASALRQCPDMTARPWGEFITLNDEDLERYGTQQDFSCWKKK